MAWYTINYACGHTEEKQLYGPTRERQRKIDWLEREGLCPECYKAHKAAERAEREEKSVNGLDLIPLEGSPKQIAWAESIRAKAIETLRKHVPGIAKQHGQEVADKYLEAVVHGVNQFPSSKDWIDVRSRPEKLFEQQYIQKIIDMGLDKI